VIFGGFPTKNHFFILFYLVLDFLLNKLGWCAGSCFWRCPPRPWHSAPRCRVSRAMCSCALAAAGPLLRPPSEWLLSMSAQRASSTRLLPAQVISITRERTRTKVCLSQFVEHTRSGAENRAGKRECVHSFLHAPHILHVYVCEYTRTGKHACTHIQSHPHKLADTNCFRLF